MQVSIRQVLTLVLCGAVLFAGMAATLTLPSGFANLPEGLLFLISVVLVGFAIAQGIAGKGKSRVFWITFLATSAVFAAISVSETISSANTLPEHVARYLSRYKSEVNERALYSNQRFDSLRHFMNLAIALTIGLVCGVVASQMSSDRRRERNGQP